MRTFEIQTIELNVPRERAFDRGHRLAYILGEIIELDHREAAEALETTTAAFRKRLSRARASITAFMTSSCGLANPANACRCRRRVATAVRLGRVDPGNLLFATSRSRAERFPRVLATIRQLDDTRRAAALYRAHDPKPPDGFISWLRAVVTRAADPSGGLTRTAPGRDDRR